MSFPLHFVDLSGYAPQERERALLVVRLAIAGAVICAAMALYHLLAFDLSGVYLATELALLAACAMTPLALRWTSLPVASGLLATVAVVAISWVSILNGGFTFHVLMWTLLVPVAIPANWHRLLWSSVAACVALLVGVFALTQLGYCPSPITEHTDLGQLIVSALSLICLFGFVVVIARTSSGVTYAHVAERDSYQRALVQSQKLSSLGQFADTLVHDFNNVLMSMDYALYLLARAIDEADPRYEEITQLEQTMERAKGLSHRLEGFGSDLDEECPTIDIDATLANLEEVARRIAKTDIAIEFSLDSGGACVEIDPSQLDQILVNLFVNANDATPGGGTIRVRSRVRGAQLVIEVSDTGEGISEKILDRLFEPFFTTKKPGAGTGLGLWGARLAARDVGGELTLDSIEGEGTTVRLTLPIAGTRSPHTSPTRREHRETDRLKPPPSSWKPFDRTIALLGWFVAPISEPRIRMWGAAVSALALVGSVLWFGFAGWYYFSFGAIEVAGAMVVAGLMGALVPLLMRLTRTIYVPMVLLALVVLGGLAVIIIARGGFPLPVLVFLLVIPLVANLQKEYPSLVIIATALCIIYVGTFFALAVTGAAPPPAVVLSPAELLGEGLAVLLASHALLTLASRAGHTVAERLIAERDQFRRALLRSQKMETMGTFASSIAHDLNNVLMCLEFSTTLLDDALPADHPSRIDIEELHDACKRIRSLSRQLVGFGRSEESESEHVAVDHALSDFESLIRPLLGRHIEVDYDLRAGDARVALSSKRLEQVLVNLLLNSRDAMSDGGSIAVATHAHNGGVTIDITDDGGGIEPSIAERVFEPFFTIDGTKSGLGLWLCKQIVEDAGGQLTLAKSTPDGTTMRIWLPSQTRRAARPGLKEPRETVRA